MISIYDDEKGPNNNKGDDDMSITKPIKPIDHEFETKKDAAKFDQWVNGQDPTPRYITDRLKRDLEHYKMMKKRHDERNN